MVSVFYLNAIFVLLGTLLWRQFGIPVWYLCCHFRKITHLISSSILPQTPQTSVISPVRTAARS